MLANLTSKKLFLVDTWGALISAFLLGVVLVYFQSYIGLPTHLLRWLSLLAIGLATYSATCFISNPTNWRLFLKLISILNLLYCLLTISLMIQYFSQLTILGIAYFVGEIIIVIAIAFVEMRFTKKK